MEMNLLVTFSADSASRFGYPKQKMMDRHAAMGTSSLPPDPMFSIFKSNSNAAKWFCSILRPLVNQRKAIAWVDISEDQMINLVQEQAQIGWKTRSWRARDGEVDTNNISRLFLRLKCWVT